MSKDLFLDLLGALGSLTGIAVIIVSAILLTVNVLATPLLPYSTTRCYLPWWIDALRADYQWVTFTAQLWLLSLLVLLGGVGWGFRLLGDRWRRRRRRRHATPAPTNDAPGGIGGASDSGDEDPNVRLLGDEGEARGTAATTRAARLDTAARLAEHVSPWRLWFSVISGVVLCTVVHANDVVLMLGAVLVSFALTKLVPQYVHVRGRRVAVNMLLHWLFTMVFLIGTANAMPVVNFAYEWTLNGAGWGLNAIGLNGLLSVQFVYHFLMLRMVSFNMDYSWASDTSTATLAADIAAAERAALRAAAAATARTAHAASGDADADADGGGGAPSYFERQERKLSVDEYTLSAFVAYVSYAPIYATGPMSSFNAFVSHLKVPQTRVSRGSFALHAARLVAYFVILSLIVCLMPLPQLPLFAPDVFATYIAPHPWRVFIVTMFVLINSYMKLLIIFRFARLLCVVDGVDVPDDMLRCPFAQHSFTSFWRSWHASLNVWIIRYFYKPLGGNRRKALLLLPVFLFVGVWHVDYQLLLWGAANALGFAIELGALALASRYGLLDNRLVEGVGGTFGLLALLSANLFIMGYDMATRLIGGMFFNPHDPLMSLAVWLFCSGFFFCLTLHSQTRDRLLVSRAPPERTHPAHLVPIDVKRLCRRPSAAAAAAVSVSPA